jgi:hypothetical protein
MGVQTAHLDLQQPDVDEVRPVGDVRAIGFDAVLGAAVSGEAENAQTEER